MNLIQSWLVINGSSHFLSICPRRYCGGTGLGQANCCKYGIYITVPAAVPLSHPPTRDWTMRISDCRLSAREVIVKIMYPSTDRPLLTELKKDPCVQCSMFNRTFFRVGIYPRVWNIHTISYSRHTYSYCFPPRRQLIALNSAVSATCSMFNVQSYFYVEHRWPFPWMFSFQISLETLVPSSSIYTFLWITLYRFSRYAGYAGYA